MATTLRQHLCLSLSLPDLHPLRPRLSRGSSGGGSMSSCSPVLDTAWDWGTCGVSPTSVTGTEEVSSCKNVSCSLKFQRAYKALVCEWVYVCVWGDLLHLFGQEALSALPLGVRCTAAATSPQKLQLKAAANPSTKAERACVTRMAKSKRANVSTLERL